MFEHNFCAFQTEITNQSIQTIQYSIRIYPLKVIHMHVHLINVRILTIYIIFISEDTQNLLLYAKLTIFF